MMPTGGGAACGEAGRPWGRGLFLGRGWAGPHLPWWRREVCALPAASCYDASLQLQWDAGDVVGAGDGRSSREAR